MKKGIITLCLFVFSLSLVSCDAFILTSESLPTTVEPIITTNEVKDLDDDLTFIYQLALESNAFTGTYDERLETVRGPQGEPGEDGKSVFIRVENNIFQWQHQGDEVWNDLFDLSLLQGEDGITPSIDINQEGYWVINGTVTSFLAGIQDGDQYVDVTFDPAGGVLPDDYDLTMSVIKGSLMDLPIPTKEGYIFDGWFVGETVNDGQFFNHIPMTENINLFAKWITDTGYNDDELLNHFYFNVIEQTNTSITVELILGGDVKSCGFDIIINFDESLVTYNDDLQKLSGMVSNVDEVGKIHYNFVASNRNLSQDTVIAEITFDILSSGLMKLDLLVNQIIELDDNGLDILNTSANTSSLEIIVE